MPALIVIIVVVVLLGVIFGAMYNSLIKLRNVVQESWAQIDVELKRRHDLIGNLVETVKGYASHERGTLDEVTQARAQAMSPGQGPADSAKSEAALSQALVKLQAVSEAYPDLKANQNFMALQQELSSTEDRIASARRYYNANVRNLNTKVETLPTNFIAGIANVGKAEYFEAEGIERQAPQVSFGSSAPAAPSLGQAQSQSQLPPAQPTAGPQDAPPQS
ncbi:LemA family protein [Lapillicoccus sp.]|uniref:LemA family protein n=1 Tax=Lapillicoccus sp. TaxID=1909287 RepID=UPI003267E280